MFATNLSSLSCDQVEELNRKLEEVKMRHAKGVVRAPTEAQEKEWATKVDVLKVEDIEEVQPNGHHGPMETNGLDGENKAISEKICMQNGDDASPLNQTPSSTSSALPPSSPCTSPLLANRPPGSSSPSGYQSPYQAGINQRFHAARHKFQGTPEAADAPPQATQAPITPKDGPAVTSSPPTEASPVKQMARSTVTQVLSRFTTAMQTAAARAATQNNSPFGTDYRSLAAPLSPAIGRAAGALSQGTRSPTISRADRGHPPPIPPKKPGLTQAPLSPAAVPRSTSHFSDSPLSGSCGLTSSQDGVKELDMVVSSN